MNKKESEVYKIIDIVIKCCAYDGNEEVLRQNLKDGKKDDTTALTRCMIARMLAFAGYTNSTIALILEREERTIRTMLESARDCRKTRRAYRIAEDEAIKMYGQMCEEDTEK